MKILVYKQTEKIMLSWDNLNNLLSYQDNILFLMFLLLSEQLIEYIIILLLK